jgi:hypothetical protein
MKRHWEPDELVDYWTLLPDELALLANKAGAMRLGFAALLKFFQIEGRFPLHKHELPPAAVPAADRSGGASGESIPHACARRLPVLGWGAGDRPVLDQRARSREE